MKKWIQRNALKLVTGAVVVGTATGSLLNASELSNMFQPENFKRVESKEQAQDYDYVAGEGDNVDLADQNQDGEDQPSGKDQQVLQVETEQQTESNTPGKKENQNTLGIADKDQPAGESENKNAVEFTAKENGEPSTQQNGTPTAADGTTTPSGDKKENGTATDGNGKEDQNHGAGNDSDQNNGNGSDGQNTGDNTENSGTDSNTRPDNGNNSSKDPSSDDNKQNTDDSKKPSQKDQDQLKPDEAVVTEYGQLLALNATMTKIQYAVFENFSEEDAVVTATFLTSDGKTVDKVLSLGSDGYQVSFTAKEPGNHTAVFRYRGMTTKENYYVMDYSVVIGYEAKTEDSTSDYYAARFPGPKENESQKDADLLKEVLGASHYEEARSLTTFPENYRTSGNIVNLREAHSRMTAYLGNADMKSYLYGIEDIGTYKNILDLKMDADGYLTNMLTGFRGVLNRKLLDTRSYLYYPDEANWQSGVQTVINYIDTVPAGYKIRVETEGDTGSVPSGGDQVLKAYTGDADTITVPMGVTAIDLEQKADGVTEISLPESVQKIDVSSIAENLPGLMNYQCQAGHEDGLKRSGYQIKDGLLYTADGKTLLSVPAGRTQVTIPEEVAYLGENCFAGLSENTIIQFAGEEIPKRKGTTGFHGIIKVADSANDLIRKNCLFSFAEECENITFQTEEAEEDPYEYLKDGPVLCAKDGVPNDRTLLAVPQNTSGRIQITGEITRIGEDAFMGCDRLTDIELGEQVTELQEGSLKLPSSVKNVTLANGEAKISAYLFGDPREGAVVPDIRIYVQNHYDQCLKEWTKLLDPVYGDGTAAKLLTGEKPSYLYEDGMKYQEIESEEGTTYRLLSVYQKSRTALQVKEGTTELAEDAFSGCENLEILMLPESLESLGNVDWIGCKALESMVIQAADVSIAGMPESVQVLRKGTDYTAFLYEEGIIYGETGGNYTLLNVPTDISGVLNIREHTVKIADHGIENCSKLTEITLEASEELKSIGESAMKGCSGLEKLSLESCLQLTEIGNYALEDCSRLTEIIFPESLTKFSDGLLRHADSLTTVTAEGITTIGDETFYECEALKSVKMSGKETSYGAYAFYGCRSLLNIQLPDSLTSLGAGCFQNCLVLADIEINGQLTNISRYCFAGCENLKSVTFTESIKNSLRVIGVQAFYGCLSLEKIDLTGLNNLSEMGTKVFAEDHTLQEIDLPDSLISLPEGCFADCNDLSMIRISGDNMISLSSKVFGNTIPQYVRILVKKEMLDKCKAAYQPVLDSSYGEGTTEKIIKTIQEGQEYIKGGVYESTEEGKILIKVDESVEGTYTIPKETVRIESDALAGCDEITGLTVQSESKIAFGDRIMKGCTGLKSVTINGTVTDWGEETFMNCSALEEIHFTGASTEVIEAIGNRAFKNCENLGKKTQNASGKYQIELGMKVKSLGEECFADCDGMTTVATSTSFVTGLEKIGNKSFQNCRSMKTFLTSKFTALRTIGEYAFQNCDSLNAPSIPAGVTSIGEGCFMDCDNITTVSFYGALEEYPKNCFRNCSKLTRTGGTAAAFAGLKRIGESAYEGCSSLVNTGTSWYLGRYANLESVGDRAFYGCSSLGDTSLSRTLQQIGDHAFDGCIAMNILTLNALTVPEIGTISFTTMAENFGIRVPDSQGAEESDYVYLSYLKYLSGKFGEEKILAILDSISDGARDRYLTALAEEKESESESESETETSSEAETGSEAETTPPENPAAENAADSGSGEGTADESGTPEAEKSEQPEQTESTEQSETETSVTEDSHPEAERETAKNSTKEAVAESETEEK